MSDEAFFDENPVIDDGVPRTGAVIVDHLPTDITSTDAVFLKSTMTVARSKSGVLELRPLNRRERFWRWMERHPRVLAALEAMAWVGSLTLPRRRAR